MMDRQLRLRKQMPFYLSTGLIIGLSREKSVASRPKSRVWWTEIVKKSFNDQQWIENFRMRKETFTYICNRLNVSLAKKENSVNTPLEVDHRVHVPHLHSM